MNKRKLNYWRFRIYDIIEPAVDMSVSRVYDAIMILAITASLVPLLFKTQIPAFVTMEKITTCIFIADYIVRWATADFKLSKYNALPFVVYPFTPMAIIDLLSILPSITLLNPAFKIMRVFRMLKAFRVLKLLRYSKSISMVANVLRRERDSLIAVLEIAFGYIFVAALILFQVEPNTFDNFYDAIYWSTISLTTIGYGDIFATSDIGRAMTMISALLGIAIVALPAGIITAGYLEELQAQRNRNSDSEENDQ